MADEQIDQTMRPGFVPVCAIGASSGGVGVLQALFRLLPDDLGLAYVVIVHLAPDHPSAMHEILATCTSMPVHQVRDGPRLRANCVYVIPPDRELVIDGDDVKARPFTDPRGHRAPIDMFFRSVAAARGDGIAVVLTGQGADGAVGVRAIKEAGGIVMVQDPADAGFPSMPQSAIATGVADVIAPVARLAERIADAARSKEAVRSLDEHSSANDLRRITAFLRTRTGHDFSGYKRATVLRRVQRRLQICQVRTLADYARHLRDKPEEAKALFADLLISVTMFFRDPAAFRALAQHVVAPLIEQAGGEEGDGEVRAWVVGCATGEEAYSLAILVLEEAERLKLHVPAQIFATDLDEGALATAREGRYPRSIEADVSPERLGRFFVDEGTHYRIGRRVRDMVLFATHSVVREPPFMRLDLVSCRNVLIYLERTLQQHVCSIFHYGLKPGGALFLGPAETADVAQSQFVALDRDARIYRVLHPGSGPIPVLAPAAPAGPRLARSTEERLALPFLDVGEALGSSHAASLEAVAPPSALVGADHVWLHLSPTAGRFILLSAGPQSSRLTSVVHPELRLDLRMALDRAFDTQQPTATRTIDLRLDGQMRRVSVHVAPVQAATGTAPRAMVFFHDDGPSFPSDAPESPPAADELRQLHGELKAAQEAVLAGRIGHEAALQELRAGNEELRSLNEEYRSTAEELETSKEELQSINEELQTVNAELKVNLSIISAAHDDLQNLTASSEIGTLFLDTHLRIRMFTPRVADVINVTTVDVGRPITDITHRLAYDGIERDVRQVMRDRQPVEREVRGPGERWFTLRVRPYRTLDDAVEGAVVTFDEITERKGGEAALKDSEMRFRAFVTASSDAVYRMSPDWTEMWQLDGRAFLPDTDEPSATWLDRYIHPHDQATVREAVERAIRTKSTFELEHRVIRLDGSLGWTLSRAVPILSEGGEIREWLGAASDVTAVKEASVALRKSETLRHIAVDSGGMGTWRWDLRQQLVWGDERFLALWGMAPSDEARPLSLFVDRMSPTGAAEMGDMVARAVAVGEEFDGQLEIVAGPTAGHWVRWRGRADPEDTSLLNGVSFDVTEQRRADRSRVESEARLRTLVDGVPQLVWRATRTGAWTWSSPQWTAYTGLSVEDSRGEGWLSAYHPDDHERARAPWPAAAQSGEVPDVEVRIRQGATGAYRWFQSRARPVRDASGVVVEWLGTSTDVQDLKAMQEAQAVLVAELQHRTRNLIAVVRGVANDTMRETGANAAFRKSFSDRLSALSRVQGLLSRLDAEPITIGALVRLELDALGAGTSDARVSVGGPDVFLRPSTVQTLALALHELATNARKYGALSHDRGHLAVTWRAHVEAGEPRLALDWVETGLEQAPEHRALTEASGGYGRELIEHALPHAMDARTTYALTPSGVRCTVDLGVRVGTQGGEA